MRREEIVKYISSHFNVDITPKTVTEAADVLKSLSDPGHKVIDFHSKGKSGYMLGNVKSPMTQSEIIHLLMSFSSISTEASKSVLNALEPYMNQSDVDLAEKIVSKFPIIEKTPSNNMDYFDKLKIIISCFEKEKEVVFDHRYTDLEKDDMAEKEKIALSPYYIFEKNGHFYLLGGQMGGIRISNGEKRSCLYIANIENMQNVKVGKEDAKDLPIKDCLYGMPFDLGRYLSRVYFIREGPFSGFLQRGHKAEIYSEYAFALTKAMYGDCVEVISKVIRAEETKTMAQKVVYTVNLHLDNTALIMWGLYFAKRGKLLVSPGSPDRCLIKRSIYSHAVSAEEVYQIRGKL